MSNFQWSVPRRKSKVRSSRSKVGNPKSEVQIRNPKVEIRKKSEIRNPKGESEVKPQSRSDALGRPSSPVRLAGLANHFATPFRGSISALATSDFGFRISFGFRPSDFGFEPRISKIGHWALDASLKSGCRW